VRAADVRPHPHIGLSTVSYLLGGQMTHRDSLGVTQMIRPGKVNWMTAGRGISHSERFEHPASFAGGEPVGPRHIWWNFVSSRKKRIEQAKADWQAGRIALPPHDNQEWIPLPG